MDPFVGQIFLLPFNFAPKGFAFCNGQLLPISQNTALFSLLQTRYGGDGMSTFALPNLQGRVPIGFSQGPGLSPYALGETGGAESVALAAAHLPQHTHEVLHTLTATARCRSGPGNAGTPVGNVPAAETLGGTQSYSPAADVSMRDGGVVIGGTMVATPTGGGTGHENRQPFIAMNYCIAMQGVFPPRS